MGLPLPCGTAALDRLLGESRKGTALEDRLLLHYTASINRRSAADGNHGNEQARRHADEVRARRQGSSVVKPGFQQNSKQASTHFETGRREAGFARNSRDAGEDAPVRIDRFFR